ncbi:hypothetical protein R9C00_19490 [Flammeovirgaceae bacterium SG7u.111]|nr:hypothetical protein [Flammeovirgaceae bacterium SG7u.132]WPO33885.1 hypothetical protein R9C00_19490 [Flammeovirgaceae bacterium SG7u.111]
MRITYYGFFVRRNKNRTTKLVLVLIGIMMGSLCHAQFRTQVGNEDFSDWSGISKVKKGIAHANSGDTISYTYSNQSRIYFPKISRNYFGDAADWTNYEGIAFDIYLKPNTKAELSVMLKVDTLDYLELNPVSTAKVGLVGQGWQSVYIPWDMFDIDAGQKWGTLFAIKHVQLTLNFATNSTFQIRNFYATKGQSVGLQSSIQGKSSDAGTSVTYEVEVGNTTDIQQGVRLRIETEGWESMKASIEPNYFDLAPGEAKKCKLTVNIPSKLPTGIREKQVVKAIANGAAVTSIEFTTAVRVPTPNIVFTAEGWQKVKDKVDKYEWAKEGLEEYENRAERWEAPKGNDFSDLEGEDLLGKSVFNTDGRRILTCAIAYQLTGDNKYAEKCLKVIRRLVREEDGYPATLVGGSNSFVGEGKFWQSIGRTYDLIRDCELVTEEDHKLVEKTFRLFVTRTIQGNTRGAISNWNVAELTAALYCALNLQDWHLIDQLLTSPTGIYKHLEHGIMSDGWWYECAVGYNTWVATEFSETAIALEPWGINFKDMKFPIGTTKHFSLLASRRKGGIYGMQFEKWGKIERNNVSIKDMWDASIPFLDYRGVLPAINDAVDAKVAGRPYELAYFLYKDPEYAAIINRSKGRDLLYGVPDLPNVTSEKMKVSAYADNMGIVQLRSKGKEREQREQIQATLHYGSHGGYHGHFDRTNLVSMMRYGRSFYGTLMYWYSYQSYLYKFLKQTSINKNMVVVDEKMQEPVENFRKLFYTGEMMQATAIETNSRWSYPPYGGIVYDPEKPFSQKMWEEGRTIPIPENAPEYGACTEFTEPVMQRRVMVVLDDYIVLADYLNAEKEHQFDWMFQAKGFRDITADKKEYLRHTNQMNADPLGSAQFITDCNWYKTEGTSRTQFEMCWGDSCDNEGVRLPHSTEGPLKIDVFNAWPQQNEIMIGTSTENFYVDKQLWYTVSADGNTLVNDSTGAWILGSQQIVADISGKTTLELTTKIGGKARNNTIFWGDAKIVLKDGSEVLVSTLPVKYENILIPSTKGKDYYGGPIKIGGEPMANSIPGMPENAKEATKIMIDLSGMDAATFKAKIGGDFPLGNEASRLKSMAVRSYGTEARYLSIVEPYENESMIKSVVAKSANELVVELIDGRVQELTISGIESNTEEIKVSVKETKAGEVLRQEQTYE